MYISYSLGSQVDYSPIVERVFCACLFAKAKSPLDHAQGKNSLVLSPILVNDLIRSEAHGLDICTSTSNGHSLSGGGYGQYSTSLTPPFLFTLFCLSLSALPPSEICTMMLFSQWTIIPFRVSYHLSLRS